MTQTLHLKYESYCTNNNDGDDSDEQYSYRGTTDTSWDFYCVNLYGGWPSESFLYDGPEPFKAGDVVHLIIAIYSTGDSFGSDRGRCMEIMGVHRKLLDAKNTLKKIEDTDRDFGNDFSFHKPLGLMTDGGVEIPYTYFPWKGYFESLDSLEIYTLTVK